jgi:hypothetical protein
MFPIQVFAIKFFGRPEYALCGRGGEGISFAHAEEVEVLAQTFVTYLRRIQPHLALQCIHDTGVLPCLIDFEHLPDLERVSETGFSERPLSEIDRRAFVTAVQYELQYGGIMS